MRRLPCRLLLLAVLVLLPRVGFPAAPSAKARRIAVLEFENVTKDKALDWIGTGIKEHLTTQLSQIPEFVVVERTRLSDTLKELNFNRSQYVDQATAQKMGKVLGVQSVVVGSYLKLDDAMRINVRLVDVETGQIKAPTLIDGSFKKFFDLQNDVARKLVAEMKGTLGDADKKQLETTPTNSVDANRALSDGVYFLRQNSLDDALTQFDAALKADPNYGEAYYYRGVALQKKQQWDESIAAFKRALPHSQAVRNVKWSWQPPFQPENKERGRMMVVDQQKLTEEGKLRLPNRILYGERAGGQTILHFYNLERKASERFVVDDPQVVFQQAALSRDGRALVQSFPIGVKEISEANVILLDAANRHTWRRAFNMKSGAFIMLLFDDFLAFYYPSGQWGAVDPETGKDRWKRDGVRLGAVSLTYQTTRKYGGVLVGASPDGKLRVLRADTGEDAWSADLPGKDSLLKIRDGIVAALDPAGKLSAFELETGAPVDVPAIELGSLRVDASVMGNVQAVPGLLRDGVLYVWTKDKAILAVDLKPGIKPAFRILWRQVLPGTPHGLEYDGKGLYVSTETGEFLALDAATGKTRGALKLSDKPVSIDDLGSGLVVASSGDAVYGLDALTAAKKWEYSDRFGGKDPRVFKGAVTFRTSAREIACLDAASGGLLWQHSGIRQPTVYTTADALFVADEDGIREYATERQAVAGIADKEVYTELARTVLLKGDAKEALTYTRRVLSEFDSNYGPARLVQASALRAQGDKAAVGRELAGFLALESSESQQFKDVLAELKKDHGLLWHVDAEAPVGAAFEAQGKVISLQGTVDGDFRLYAFDKASGQIAWRHPGQRLMQAVPDPEHGRVYYLTGHRENPQLLDVFAVAVNSGDRNKVATITSPREVNRVRFGYSAGRLYLGEARLDFQAQKITLHVVAMQADSGKVLWEKTHTTSFLRPPGLWYARGDRFYYSLDQDLWVVNGADGAELAHRAEPGAVVPSGGPDKPDPAATSFYYADGEHKVMQFDMAKNTVTWQAKITGLPANTRMSVDLVRGGILYDWDQTFVYAVRVGDPVTGDLPLLWKVDFSPGQSAQQLAVSDGRLFVRRSDNMVLELDPATGKLLRQYPLLWDAGMSVVSKDVAYVMSTTGRAYAVRLDAGGSR